jgi:hypothetical protein
MLIYAINLSICRSDMVDALSKLHASGSDASYPVPVDVLEYETCVQQFVLLVVDEYVPDIWTTIQRI